MKNESYVDITYFVREVDIFHIDYKTTRFDVEVEVVECKLNENSY